MPSSYVQYNNPASASQGNKNAAPISSLTRIPVNDYVYTTAEHPGMYFLTDAGAKAKTELNLMNQSSGQPPWSASSPYAALGPQWADWNNARKSELERLLNPTATAQPSVASPTPYFKAPAPMPAASPAGNNIASGIVTPQTAPTPVTPTGTPNTGTLGTDINQSPFTPGAGTRKRTSPNKYFNQRWFGTKNLA